MTGLATRLAEHLYSRDQVFTAFKQAHLRLAGEILDGPVDTLYIEEPEWQHLMTWASVLSQSDIPEHVELALVAAVSAFLSVRTDGKQVHQAAGYILEACSNTPTLNLARQRGLVHQAVVASKLPALLKDYQRRLQHFIFDDFKSAAVPVTDFQERIWDALIKHNDAALSAPTSAGKSFVLVRWIAQSLFNSEPGSVVCYVVPSRALISQIRQNIAEILLEYDVRPRIISMPTLYQNDENRETILIMTQERIERLFAVDSTLKFKTLVIDEAQKLGDGPRGVILQRVIDEALSRFEGCRVILAAPHAKNADILLPRIDLFGENKITSKVISDSRPTVLQNLFWVTPIPRRKARWKVTLVREKEIGQVGELQLKGSATGKKKRLAALAYHLGSRDGGNIVFANGPAEAEEIALLIKDHISAENHQPEIDEEVLDLARLVKESVHPVYPLGETLLKGVGIHYGDMPEISRREQERLFDEGKLSFLVCTSTLLEGVNLPCRNLYIWGPRQGHGKTMTEHTFWNLAGRAGRWGREFAGNIFCVDVFDEKQWPTGPPARRYAQQIDHSGSELLASISSFSDFVNSGDPANSSRKNRYFEQILGELVGVCIDGLNVSSVGWARWGSKEQIDAINELVESVIDKITAPPNLIKRHRSINPLLISNFLEFLESLPPDDPESFMPMTPDMPSAIAVLGDNLRIIDEHLGGDFGNQSQRNLKAALTVHWIRGLPLGRIIKQRVDYRLSQKEIKIPAEIRAIIKLINTNARYSIPKYLACYSDCVAHWFSAIGREDLAHEVSDIQDMLETGVSEKTMIALVGLGLSRTAAVEIASHIPDTELSTIEVIQWLKDRSLRVYEISPVIIREVERVLEATEFV